MDLAAPHPPSTYIISGFKVGAHPRVRPRGPAEVGAHPRVPESSYCTARLQVAKQDQEEGRQRGPLPLVRLATGPMVARGCHGNPLGGQKICGPAQELKHVDRPVAPENCRHLGAE
jgi:hypothetical protein